MQRLSSRNLLVLAPHFKTFIKNQTNLIRRSFASVAVLIPVPRFAKVALSLPRIGSQFYFANQVTTSNSENDNCNVFLSKFSTLPLKTMRKRNCFLFTRSCIKTLASKKFEFDLVHAHFVQLGYIGATLREQQNKPFILTAHGGDVYDFPFRDDWHQGIAKYILSKTDRVITVSRFNADRLLSLGVSLNKLHIIPNGYDAKLFKPFSSPMLRKKLGLPATVKVLLSVGNLVDVKGHDYLVDAMSIVLKKQTNVILVIIGSGPLKERLQKKATELGLSEKIVFAGSQMHEEIPTWMNASDIFVLPSVKEGFPTVIPEAMACGKPVVGTKVGGVPEAITNDNLGILTNPKDHEALASAILEALERKWEPEAILQYAKRYSWNTIVQQIISVYQKVLEN